MLSTFATPTNPAAHLPDKVPFINPQKNLLWVSNYWLVAVVYLGYVTPSAE